MKWVKITFKATYLAWKKVVLIPKGYNDFFKNKLDTLILSFSTSSIV